MSTSVEIEERGPVLVARMTRLENRNALDSEMKAALHAAAARYAAEPAFRCLVITGAEDIFCAGGDLQGMAADTRPAAVRARMARTHAVARTLAACEKPVITAVNGAAIGAGLSLALLGDVIVAADDAFFMTGFPRFGVLPDLGLIYHLPRAVGMPRAKDILLTNPRIAAAEAQAMGLVSRVLPKAGFEAAVLALATQLAEGPTVSLGLTRMLMNASHGESLEDFLLKETLAQAAVFGTGDFLEGNTAFKERRKPSFRGE